MPEFKTFVREHLYKYTPVTQTNKQFPIILFSFVFEGTNTQDYDEDLYIYDVPMHV